jgi:23S rRNA (cytidine2498-2'-O)-methyltransferase
VKRLDAFITSVGYEAALAAELGGAAGPRWPAVVSRVAGEGDSELDPVWARQQVPGAIHLKGESVKDLAEATYAAVEGAIDAATAFTLHACVPDPEAYEHLARRASLIGEALLELLAQRRRRAWRRLVPSADAPARWGELLVVQLVLVGRTSLLVSAARPRARARGGFDVAPWPAGIAPVAEDKAAPSRAYGKLEEGFAWLGAAPASGQLCVDLGGSPGGWAWKALVRGAQVIAVDRSPLEPPAAGHPALTMVQGNAFTYEPPRAVDWLLCDVICEPPRTFELVERWVTNDWCRAVVATVKWKGSEQYHLLAPALARLGELLDARGWRFLRGKHLFRHHNEVALLLLR